MKNIKGLIATLIAIAVWALVFYFSWNNISSRYFSSLPPLYWHIPYKDCFCLLMVIRALTQVLRGNFISIPSKAAADGGAE